MAWRAPYDDSVYFGCITTAADRATIETHCTCLQKKYNIQHFPVPVGTACSRSSTPTPNGVRSTEVHGNNIA